MEGRAVEQVSAAGGTGRCRPRDSSMLVIGKASIKALYFRISG